MITLKSKIIRNFIAGILACVLVFSILVTLFVTFNYREHLINTPDSRPRQVYYWFKKYNNDPNISRDQMYENLEYLAEDLQVDIAIIELNGIKSFEALGRDKSNNFPIVEDNKVLFNQSKGRDSGTLQTVYNVNPEPILKLQRDFSTAIVYGLSISLIIGFIISLILSENISEPIMTMSDATVRMKDGGYFDPKGNHTDIKELENLQTNISYLSKNLKSQEEIRKQYAQDISHELRTPLTNLQLYIEAIKDGVVEADESTMDILLEDVKRLDGLVEGLKKSFDENVKELELVNEVIDVSKLVNKTVLTFQVAAELNNIKLNTFIEDDIIMTTDADKFNQILQNLITNAMKAIGEDGEVDIYLTEDDNEVTLRVVDDGIGIEADKIDRIFERFYRIEDARNTKENGHGLGLSITKNFAEALGGKISVESKINKGSAFEISFIK